MIDDNTLTELDHLRASLTAVSAEKAELQEIDRAMCVANQIHYDGWIKAETALAEVSRRLAQVTTAMFAFLDLLKAQGTTFHQWPDDVKEKFSEAIIDRSPITEAEIQRTKELAEKYGWK